jgi:antitoxin component YwqK of YwqJK toxin-antitoxin module
MTGSLDPQGEKHGEWSAYYESGQLWSQGTFEHGIAHGQRVMYHENGVKFGQGRFENGQETGTWEFWDKQGNRLKSKSYGKAAQ